MSAERGRSTTYMDLQNPLFLHPSDGPGSMPVAEKLQGSTNYRSWRRGMEINFATKRKLGFLNGVIERSTNDPIKADQWDACNNMVIAWLMHSVIDSIAKSVLYVESAQEIWLQLEKRFSVSNGSRKYRLNRETYMLRQSGMSINDYYTKRKTIWEEIDSMNTLPRIRNASAEVLEYLRVMEKYKEEERLFQFLNGLDDVYSAQRSQILIKTSLPSVELVCSMLQQEESQKEVFDARSSDQDVLALYGWSNNNQMRQNTPSSDGAKCEICGKKWHPREKCWQLVGYPDWHYKSRKSQQQKDSSSPAPVSKNVKGKETEPGTMRMVNQVEKGMGQVTFTQKQFEALLQRIPQFNVKGLSIQEAEGDW